MNAGDSVPPKPYQFECETDSGAYQLLLYLDRTTRIVVGALGPHTFPSGAYLYTGRASRHLRKRIERHFKTDKKLRWHIDYLLDKAHIREVRVYPGRATDECVINRETARTLQGVFPVKGFGSSDCRCTSHLLMLSREETKWFR